MAGDDEFWSHTIWIGMKSLVKALNGIAFMLDVSFDFLGILL